jgi:predicted metalloprotease
LSGIATFIAHEFGHHVQRTVGMFKVSAPHRMSIDVELGADCPGGMWAADVVSRNRMTSAEVEQALAITFAVGDKTSTSQLDAQAHGSPEMRAGAFSVGLTEQDRASCLAL